MDDARIINNNSQKTEGMGMRGRSERRNTIRFRKLEEAANGLRQLATNVEESQSAANKEC